MKILQMPGIRHARCPAKPLVVSLEMRSFHSEKEVRLQRGEFIWLHQYVGCSKTTEQNVVALPQRQALNTNLNSSSSYSHLPQDSPIYFSPLASLFLE